MIRRIDRVMEEIRRENEAWRNATPSERDALREQFRRNREASLKEAEERLKQQQLMLVMIDAGYKALAMKMHPDKGGTSEQMTRLNLVRKQAWAVFGLKPPQQRRPKKWEGF